MADLFIRDIRGGGDERVGWVTLVIVLSGGEAEAMLVVSRRTSSSNGAARRRGGAVLLPKSEPLGISVGISWQHHRRRVSFPSNDQEESLEIEPRALASQETVNQTEIHQSIEFMRGNTAKKSTRTRCQAALARSATRKKKIERKAGDAEGNREGGWIWRVAVSFGVVKCDSIYENMEFQNPVYSEEINIT